ncbi:MAG: hypothetical protein Q8M31_12420, partial [Beijerinckiaceae bacterium]|nr:hypothetical protein [Beijerinckiaceae bacterium]
MRIAQASRNQPGTPPMTRAASFTQADMGRANPEPFLLTREQASALCNLSPAGFSLWVREGRLPHPIAGTRRWHRDSLRAALDRLAGVC